MEQNTIDLRKERRKNEKLEKKIAQMNEEKKSDE